MPRSASSARRLPTPPRAAGPAGPPCGGRHSASGARVPAAASPAGTDAPPRDVHGKDPYGGGAYVPGDDDTRQLIVPTQRGTAPDPARHQDRPYDGGPHQGGQRPERNTAESTGHGSGPGRDAHGTRPGRTPGGRRKGPMLAVGAVGALIVVVGALLLAPGDDAAKATPTPSVAPTKAAPELPVGVECSGADCAGQDPEAMGCGGEFARTVVSAVVGGSKIEVRYSEVCSASWARLTEGAIGDTVRITMRRGSAER